MERAPKVPAKDPYSTFALLPPPPRILHKRASQDSIMTTIEHSLARLAASSSETVNSIPERPPPTPAKDDRPSSLPESQPSVPTITRSSLPGSIPQPVQVPSYRHSAPYFRPRLSTIAPSPDASADMSGDLSVFASSVADSSASSHSGPFALEDYVRGRADLRPMPVRQNSRPRSPIEPPSPSSLSPDLALAISSTPVTPSPDGESPIEAKRDYFGLMSSPAVKHAMSRLEGQPATETTAEGKEVRGRSAMELQRPDRTTDHSYDWLKLR